VTVVKRESVITRKCWDCQAVIGEPHLEGCDIARCLATGGQRLMCEMLGGTPAPYDTGDGQTELGVILDGHDCGQDTHTGWWPGVVEAEEFGWFTYFGPDVGETGWHRCTREHPAAVHDLTRVITECRWDRQAKRWQLPLPAQTLPAMVE
jgi:hypothetical protein